MTKLSQRFEEALAFAARLHQDQVRKGSDVPYVAHLLAVASLVLEYGGNEDEAIAGLLHDAVEDQGGAATREEIYRRFGPEVGHIVDGCTDTDQTPKPPWRARKEAYLAHLAAASPSVRLVSAADKLHNVRSLILDYRRLGEQLWTRFSGGKAGTLWYYQSVAAALRQRGPAPIVDQLERELRELAELVAASATGEAQDG